MLGVVSGTETFTCAATVTNGWSALTGVETALLSTGASDILVDDSALQEARGSAGEEGAPDASEHSRSVSSTLHCPESDVSKSGSQPGTSSRCCSTVGIPP